MSVVHVNVCPECGTADSRHLLDPPPLCQHEYERFVPVRYVDLEAAVEHLRSATRLDQRTGGKRAVSGWRAAADELAREFGTQA